MHFCSFLVENNKLVNSKMLMRPSAGMFNLRIRVRSRKKRKYLQNGSSNPSEEWCNRIFGSFLRRKQLTIFLVRADHSKVPLPPLKLPLCIIIQKLHYFYINLVWKKSYFNTIPFFMLIHFLSKPF